MPVHKFAPILGKRLRATKLDVCGNPLPAGTENAGIATDGFIAVSLTAETEDGTEIVVKNAAGALCVSETTNPSFKNFTVEIQFCGVNPALLAIVTNADEYLDYAGDIAGITVAEGEIAKMFGLELWTGLSGGTCGEGDEASGYLLLPFVRGGVLGDIEIGGEDAINFSLTSAATRSGNGWGIGPYNVLKNASGAAAPLPTALDPRDHLLLIDTALAPPPSSDEPFTMPARP